MTKSASVSLAQRGLACFLNFPQAILARACSPWYIYMCVGVCKFCCCWLALFASPPPQSRTAALRLHFWKRFCGNVPLMHAYALLSHTYLHSVCVCVLSHTCCSLLLVAFTLPFVILSRRDAEAQGIQGVINICTSVFLCVLLKVNEVYSLQFWLPSAPFTRTCHMQILLHTHTRQRVGVSAII